MVEIGKMKRSGENEKCKCFQPDAHVLTRDEENKTNHNPPHESLKGKVGSGNETIRPS